MLSLLALRDRGLVERRAHAFGELDRVVIGPEMDEEHPGLLVQHVTMDRRDLDAVRPQRPDQRIDLVDPERRARVRGMVPK